MNERWLTQAARDLAISKLRTRKGSAPGSLLADQDLQDAAGQVATWDALRLLLSRASDLKTGTRDATLRLASRLTGWSETDLVTADRPPSTLPPSSRRRVSRIKLSCPKTIYDHKTIILGELPAGECWPLVLVHPLDGGDEWYPQLNLLHKGQAFACHARFGNAHGVGQRRPPPLGFELRVCAVQTPWPYKDEVCPSSEISRILEQLQVLAQESMQITRHPSVAGVVLTQEGQSIQLSPPSVVPCQAPVTLSWQNENLPTIAEVRSAVSDRLVDSKAVVGSLVLALDASQATTHESVFVLDGPGLYRVRIHSGRLTFLDPSNEWWLEIH